MQKFQASYLVALMSLAQSSLMIGQDASAADVVVAFDTSAEGQVSIMIGEDQVAVYVYQDKEISRPYFAHLRPPGGPQVSRNHPPVEGEDRADHGTYHPGLWMSFGDISGNDYWRLKAPVQQVRWAEPPQGGPGEGSFAVINRYLGQENRSQTICEEHCKFTVVAQPTGYLLLWDSTFSGDDEFYFGDQEEMGIGIRVATLIRVEEDEDGVLPAGNGAMVDSAGRMNGKEIWGKTADWCDYRGTLQHQRVGMAILCHPQNFRPSWFHARDYGLLEANPFGRAAFGHGETSRVMVKPGEELRLRYGVLVHASTKETPPDLAAAYREYVDAAGR